MLPSGEDWSGEEAYKGSRVEGASADSAFFGANVSISSKRVPDHALILVQTLVRVSNEKLDQRVEATINS